MPKRKSVKKHKSDEVQGEGSYVITSGVKVKEIRKIRKLSAEDESFDEFEGGITLLGKHILAWNWVDDDGNPLPVPKDSPETDVIGELTEEEAEWLVGLLIGATAKNSSGGPPATSG